MRSSTRPLLPQPVGLGFRPLASRTDLVDKYSALGPSGKDGCSALRGSSERQGWGWGVGVSVLCVCNFFFLISALHGHPEGT